MKTHTTNYTNTFIEVAEDSPALSAQVPPVKEGKLTIANMQFDLISNHPYQYTSDDILFMCHAQKLDLSPGELKAEREKLFSKGQACLRASPLSKRYGWGTHHNAEGKVALVAMESDNYRKLAADQKLGHTRAMRSKRA